MTPAKEVGGDFYDFFLVDDDHLALVIADVSGKGVPAALFMVIAKTLLKNAAQTGLSPKEVLQVFTDTYVNINDHIRLKMGIRNIPLMGILYQSTYEHIASLGNIIMAISTSQFGEESYFASVARTKADGFKTESHADSFDDFDKINHADIDYISTDLLAPDYTGQGKTVYLSKGRNTAKIAIESAAVGKIEFGAVYLDLEWRGSATITLNNQTFTLPTTETSCQARHQLLIFDDAPAFRIISSSENFQVKRISLRIVQF